MIGVICSVCSNSICLTKCASTSGRSLLLFAGGTHGTSNLAALHEPGFHAGGGAHAEQSGKVRLAEPVSSGSPESNSRVENSRGKRSLPDVDLAPDHDSRGHISLVASTSALVSAPSTKRGPSSPLPDPSLCVVALLTLPLHITQPSAPRRVNVPFAENISRSAFSGSTTNSSPHAYRPFSTTSAISSASLTHTLRHTHRTSAISVGTLYGSTQSFLGRCSHNRTAGPSCLGVPLCMPAMAQRRSLYASRRPSAPSCVGERRETWHSAL